jgi:hypothetical protein
MKKCFASAVLTLIVGGVALKGFSMLMNEYRPGFGTSVNSNIESFVFPSNYSEIIDSFNTMMGATAGDSVAIYMIILNATLLSAGLYVIGGLIDAILD